MNMATALEKATNTTVYFMGASMQCLEDFFAGPEGKRFESAERISIRDAKTLGPGVEKIEKAKEDIRSGAAKVLELGPPQVIVFT